MSVPAAAPVIVCPRAVAVVVESGGNNLLAMVSSTSPVTNKMKTKITEPRALDMEGIISYFEEFFNREGLFRNILPVAQYTFYDQNIFKIDLLYAPSFFIAVSTRAIDSSLPSTVMISIGSGDDC